MYVFVYVHVYMFMYVWRTRDNLSEVISFLGPRDQIKIAIRMTDTSLVGEPSLWTCFRVSSWFHCCLCVCVSVCLCVGTGVGAYVCACLWKLVVDDRGLPLFSLIFWDTVSNKT